ncbi:unnamed protein product [Sphagnum balticum]
MALREALGASSGELMREDAIPGGRMTRPRVFRWQICGGCMCSCCHATFAWLWEPAFEPQNIVAYDSQQYFSPNCAFIHSCVYK